MQSIDKKYIKKLFVYAGIFIFILDMATRIAGGAGGLLGNKRMLKVDPVVRPTENICLHILPNAGSGENVQLVTYYCDKEPDWGKVQFAKSKENVIDYVFTTECPVFYHTADIEFENLIKIKQDQICKAFAHSYPDESEEMYIVEQGGMIRKAVIAR